MMRWGLIPCWATDAGIADRTINARSESIADKPMFRDAWRAWRRCLIPIDAFYEWKTVGKAKKPLAVAAADGGMLELAGLWESWTGADGVPIRSFSIITTAASTAMAALHDRMPAIIAPADYWGWLTSDDGQARGLLAPSDAEVRMWAGSAAMNKVGRLDGPECLAAAVESQGRLI